MITCMNQSNHNSTVLDRAGYVRVNYNLTNDWSVMWAHDYPFTKIKPILMKMKKHQKVEFSQTTGPKIITCYGLPEIG